MILVGYHNDGAYWLYNRVLNKIEDNIDVKGIEKEAWDWKQGFMYNSSYVVDLDDK